MSTQRTICWSCGGSFFKADRHCPECGSDSWNPPQGSAARTSASAISYVTPNVDGRQTTIAAGVGILATLAALSFWFWVVISVMAAIKPPDIFSGGDILSTPRLLIGFVIAVGGATGTWMLARMVVEG